MTENEVIDHITSAAVECHCLPTLFKCRNIVTHCHASKLEHIVKVYFNFIAILKNVFMINLTIFHLA